MFSFDPPGSTRNSGLNPENKYEKVVVAGSTFNKYAD